MNEKHLSDIVRGLIKKDITDDFDDIENILSYIKTFDWKEMMFSEIRTFLGDLQKCSCGDWNDSTSMVENKQGKYGSYICLRCAKDL